MEPNIQGQPMNPMDSNVPTESVTQIDVTEASVPVAPAPEKKSGKGMLLGLIFCLILAAGGIGFGVWTMMDSNTQKTNYEKQISNLNSQISALQEQAAKGDDEDKGDDTDDVDPADYIYVGEWGLKIKTPDGLDKTSYSFEQNDDGYAGLDDYTSITISGVKGYDGRLPEFANLDKNTSGMITVARFPIGTEIPLASPPSLIFSDDKYDYYYYHPQAVYSVGDEEKGLEVDSVEMIQGMVKDANNWSAI